MTIPPIAPIGQLSALSTTPDIQAANGSSGASFATALGNGFDAVSATQANADSLAVQAAQGTLTDPAQLTIAATQASLMTQLATTVESKAVAAFNQIMGMQA